jgi:energy-converting hydrogenase A subunit M
MCDLYIWQFKAKINRGFKMKNPKSLKHIISLTPFNEFFAFTDIIKIVSKTPDFRNWLKEYHKIKDDKDIFEGHKFFLLTSLKCLIDSIVKDKLSKLKEDYTFFRADFIGIPLEDIPNTCEKTIVLKNIWNLSKEILKCKNWNELERGLKNLEELFEVFDKIYVNATPTKEINKKESLRLIAMGYTFLLLNDMRHGYPFGYLFPPIIKRDMPMSAEYLKKSFKGYVYSLQYLWLNLLGPTKFEKSCLNELHKAPKVYSKEVEDDTSVELEGSFPPLSFLTKEENLPDAIKKAFVEDLKIRPPSKEDLKELNKKKERQLQIKDWFALDKFYRRVQDEIITPLEKKLKIDLTGYPLLAIKKIDKSVFGDLLSKENLAEPEYLNKEDKESLKKQLDYHLLWYAVDVLDAQQSTVFNGIPAFISTLVGYVYLKKLYKNKERVEVRVFKHPAPRDKGHYYSYAILVESHSSLGISDYSGWLIFLDCATDFSGFGGPFYAQAQSVLKKLKKERSIEVREISIDKNLFKDYLFRKSVSSVSDISLMRFEQARITRGSASLTTGSQLIEKLSSCAPGSEKWNEYEKICKKILVFLFVPPLKEPLERKRTETGLHVRDLIFHIPYEVDGLWQYVQNKLSAVAVIVDCKNYSEPITGTEVITFGKYLGDKKLGRFGIIVSRLPPAQSAMNEIKRVWNDENKLILCLDDEHLKTMIKLKSEGIDPKMIIEKIQREFLQSLE